MKNYIKEQTLSLAGHGKEKSANVSVWLLVGSLLPGSKVGQPEVAGAELFAEKSGKEESGTRNNLPLLPRFSLCQESSPELGIGFQKLARFGGLGIMRCNQ